MHQRTDNLPHVVVLGALLSILTVGSLQAQVVDTAGLLTRLDPTIHKSRPGPEEIWRVGLHAGVGLDHHMAEGMTGLPGVPNCCDGFYTGSSSSWQGGFLAELPLAGDFSFGWRLALWSMEGGLKRTIREEINADRQLVIGEFVHSVSVAATSGNLDAYIGYRPFGRFSIRAGLQGTYQLSIDYSQEERLEHPEGVVYPNGRRTRLEYNGPVAIAQPLHLAASAGLRYDIPIVPDASWLISGEIGGYYGFTPLLEGTSWRMTGLVLGLALQRVHLFIPDLPDASIDVVLPIRSGPSESLGTERDEDPESLPEDD